VTDRVLDSDTQIFSAQYGEDIKAAKSNIQTQLIIWPDDPCHRELERWIGHLAP
jgi:hypothetical protein